MRMEGFIMTGYLQLDCMLNIIKIEEKERGKVYHFPYAERYYKGGGTYADKIFT